MPRSIEERKARAMDQFDKRFVQLEEWTTRLIRAAKKVESLRRECKALRSKTTTLGQLIEVGKELKRKQRRESREAARGVENGDLGDDLGGAKLHEVDPPVDF